MSARDDIRAKRRRARRHRLWLRRTGNGTSITVNGDTLTIRSYRGDSRMDDWGRPPLYSIIHMSEAAYVNDPALEAELRWLPGQIDTGWTGEE